MTLPRLATIIPVLAVATLCQANAQPTVTEEQITFEASDGSAVDAFRGTMTVPENRADPDSRMIELAYVRFPATGAWDGEGGDPIIYLAGGPGGSGIGTAEGRRFSLFMAMRAYGDVIAFDQRGTGASNDMPECTSSVEIGYAEVLSDAAVADRYREAAEECALFWQGQGIDLAGYTTRESVKDIDDLRQALGADQVTLWGISYGSHLALAALKDIEEGVGKVVLASVEGLDQTVKLPARTDAYFGRLQQAINSDPAAAAAFPDIAALMRRVHARLDSEPLELTLTIRGEEQAVVFQRMHMQQIASAMIADPENAAQLIGIYFMLDQGDTGPLMQLLSYFMAGEGTALSFRPMSLAMDIASGISAERLALVEEQAETSLLRDYLNFPMPQLNGMLGLDLGDEFRTDPVSDVPVLVLTGTLDGRTYPEGQREATAGLSNAVHIEVTNAGHNLFMASPEVTARIEAFMAGEEVSTDPILVPLPAFLPQ
ncbi:alpha/beta hydrolase [Parvularcula flava]|uniref:Alpha/beta hydrolase n=1 Tax=Aquisalinus luteolus TaxID=1566827 RepID=A0A8J3A216_9PROT|nr:alpha/beta hydrolase [Aquisalinus luteolus]NHK27032.1 alpha/beta hydrolase [Aquisalinus luteolus]GGH94157.1 alpha/beta hydrolase [Aquisalinus luteolus]